jgi:uncharacterized protein HemX
MDGLANSLAAAALVGAIGSVVFALVEGRRRERRDEQLRRGDRIEALLQNLNHANEVIREIEVEIRGRQALAEKLQRDAAQAERLLELNREQLDAVRRLVGSEFKGESRRGLWIGAAINFVFFVAGAALSLLLS